MFPLHPIAPLYPIPVVIPLTASSVVLLAQNSHLLTAKLIERELNIPTKINSLKIQPFSSTLKVSGLECYDPKERKPLFSIPKLSIKVRFPKLFRKPDKIEVNAETVLFTTILYRNGRRVSSNWTRLSLNDDNNNEKDDNNNKNSGSTSPTDLTLSLQINQPQMILRNRKYDSITPVISLPRLFVTSDNVSSISSFIQLIEGISASAVKRSSLRAFQPDARELLSKWIKNSQRETQRVVEQAVTWSRFNVPLLREQLRRFDEVVDEVPGLQDVQSWASRVDRYLEAAERLVKRNDRRPAATGRGAASLPPRSQGSASTNAQTSSVMEGFRELDEGE